jgi:peptide-methionine (S)-S-oxide reductase
MNIGWPNWTPLAALAVAIGMFAAHSVGAEQATPPGAEVATFAGGCFWCMEPAYDKLDGVFATVSGYTGGENLNPTYQEVSAGGTGHTEAVQITFDANKVSYKKLLEVFWMNVDPTVRDRQFCDRGNQYRTGIFYHGDEQRRLAQASKSELDATKPFNDPIVTEITAADTFYPAEEYHQDYYKKNPLRYKFYRYNCGRDKRLNELWGNSP